MLGSRFFTYRFIIGIGLGGIGMIGFGIGECNMSSFGKAEPKTLTAAELFDQGFGDNNHVLLTDFALGSNSILTKVSGRRGRVSIDGWIPIATRQEAMDQINQNLESRKRDDPDGAIEVSLDDFDFQPGFFRGVIMMANIDDENDVLPVYERETLQGVVTKGSRTIASGDFNLLKKNYPGVNFKNVYVLDLDKKPAGFFKLILYFSGGVALIGLALFMGLKAGESN